MSVSSLNCQSGSGRMSTGVFVMIVVSFSWASICLGPHSNGMSFLVSAVRGVAMIEKLGQNMCW